MSCCANKKRPCRICRRWFEPDPRAGARQRVCSSPECQRQRNQRACASWRARHPDAVAASRLRKRLIPAVPEDPAAVVVSPMRYFDGDTVRHAVGVKVLVLLEEVAKVIVCIARHGVPPKMRGKGSESTKVIPSTARHEIDAAPGEPIAQYDAHTRAPSAGHPP